MLKDLREKMGLTQKDLASKLCVSESTISLWENGERTPKISMMVKIANVLGVEDILVFKCFIR